jgi:hypothetical protein
MRRLEELSECCPLCNFDGVTDQFDWRLLSEEDIHRLTT